MTVDVRGNLLLYVARDICWDVLRRPPHLTIHVEGAGEYSIAIGPQERG